MRTSVLLVLTLAILTTTLLSGCAKEEEKSIKIGVLIPETGKFAAAGKSMKNAGILAKEHIEKFKLSKYKIELVFADTGSSPEKAEAVFRQLAEQGVIAIVGAYSSPEAIACAKAAGETKVVYIASVASTEKLEEMVENGNVYVFRNAYNTSYWGELASKFLEISRADGFYFVGFEPLKIFNLGMLEKINESGVENKGVTFYKSPAVDPKDVIEKAKEVSKTVGDRDVVILGDPGSLSVTFVKEYRNNGGKGLIYSVGGVLALPQTLKQLNQSYIVFQAAALEETPKTELTKAYFEDYRKKFGEEANNYAALLTYDAILIIAQAYNGGDLVKSLEKGEFKGAAGIYKFDKKHQAMWGSDKLKGVIAEYVDGKVEVLYPAEYRTSEVVWP